jgi:hypothetical protein
MMVSKMEIIFLANDNLLQLNGLKDVATGDYMDSATVTVTLKDSNGSEVVGQTWPTTLIFVVGSTTGQYRCTLNDELVLTTGDAYTAEITADGGPGLRGHWHLAVEARTRIE